MSYNHRHNLLRNAIISFIFLFVTGFYTVNAQINNRFHYDVNWQQSVKEKLTDKETVQILKFETAVYRTSNDLYPRMVLSLPYSFNGYNVIAEITGAAFETLKEDESAAIIYDLPADFEISTQIIREHRQSQLIVTILPLRKTV